MPLFSICVSVYNGDRFLHGCLDSVLSQSLADFELIVVDDASSDGTADILADYAKRDERITIISKRQNEGLHLGHRAALEACSGDYVLFLDADDEFEEGLLSKIDCVLCEERDVDMLHFGVRVIGEGVPGELCSSFESFVNQPVEAGYSLGDIWRKRRLSSGLENASKGVFCTISKNCLLENAFSASRLRGRCFRDVRNFFIGNKTSDL